MSGWSAPPAPPGGASLPAVAATLSSPTGTRSGQKLNSILLTFQNQRLMYKSAFSTNAQSRFASVVVDSDLGPPRLARHT